MEDNLHYEKFADGTVKGIEDKIPFEVPEEWEWCRFGTCTINRDSERKPVSLSDRSTNLHPFFLNAYEPRKNRVKSSVIRKNPSSSKVRITLIRNYIWIVNRFAFVAVSLAIALLCIKLLKKDRLFQSWHKTVRLNCQHI